LSYPRGYRRHSLPTRSKEVSDAQSVCQVVVRIWMRCCANGHQTGGRCATMRCGAGAGRPRRRSFWSHGPRRCTRVVSTTPPPTAPTPTCSPSSPPGSTTASPAWPRDQGGRHQFPCPASPASPGGVGTAARGDSVGVSALPDDRRRWEWRRSSAGGVRVRGGVATGV